MGTTQKIMFQPQCVADFMRQHFFYLFVLQRVRQLYIPCLRIIRSTLSKIPFLLQIQDTAENSDMTRNNFTGPRFARRWPIGVILP